MMINNRALQETHRRPDEKMCQMLCMRESGGDFRLLDSVGEPDVDDHISKRVCHMVHRLTPNLQKWMFQNPGRLLIKRTNIARDRLDFLATVMKCTER